MPASPGVGRRAILRGALLALTGGAALGAAGCSADATYSDTDMAKQFLKETWGIDLPGGAEVEDYFSSESDFQGGRDDAYLIEVPEDARKDLWDTRTYDTKLTGKDLELARSIAASSGAPFSGKALESWTCRTAMDSDQNALLPCWDDDAQRYVIFERIF